MYDYTAIAKRIPRMIDDDEGALLPISQQAARLGVSEGTIRRALINGLDPYKADRLCIKGLGVHPAGIFGLTAWIEADDIARDTDGEIDGGEHATANKVTRQRKTA